jgi:hypothetical protein
MTLWPTIVMPAKADIHDFSLQLLWLIVLGIYWPAPA